MSLILAQAEVLTATERLIDKGAMASDRWLFLFMLALILFGGATIVWWLVKSLEKKDAIHAAAQERWEMQARSDSDKAKSERKEDQSAFLAALAQRDSHIAALTSEVRAAKDLLTQHCDDMKAAHGKETQDYIQTAIRAAVETYRRENTPH